MKKFIFGMVSLLCAFYPTVASARQTTAPYIFSHDGEFLGFVVNDNFNDKSICNRFSKYGSQFEDSIFNKFGDYGNNYSDTSAYNPRALYPPAFIINNEIVAFVTKNRKFGRARLDPDFLLMEACGR